jgi:tetratricopeptide (TPR) repeat protein
MIETSRIETSRIETSSAPARSASADVEVERMYAEVRAGLFGARAEVRVGRYVVRRRLGQGGMGVVYEADDVDLERRIALKVLHAGDPISTEDRRRVLREAQAMARVGHPNCVTVYEVGLHGEQVYVAMELVEGPTLAAWLRAAPRTWPEIVRVFVQAARGLAAMHDAGLVHRDFKPDNVLIGGDERVRVSDFGLARRAHVEPGAHASSTRLGGSSTFGGSAAYMSPEQHDGGVLTPRSDQFGFCVALFEALYGTRPFAGDDLATLRRSVAVGEIEWPASRGIVPDAITRVLMRGLARDPDARFEDMHALLARLEAVLHPGRRGRVVAALVLTAIAAVAASVASRPEAAPDACEAIAVQAEEVWNPSRRAEVVAALRDTSAPFASDTAEQAGARLDAYATAWAQARDRTCAPPRADAPIDDEARYLALACLERSLGQLGGLRDALLGDPSGMVEHALRATYKLRAPEECVRAPERALARRSDRELAVAPELGEIWNGLDEARALLEGADPTRALPVAKGALERARRLGDAATIAEAQYVLGTVLAGNDELDAAEQALFDAAVEAERAGELEVLAQSRTELVVVVGYRQGRVREGLRWGVLAEAALGASAVHGLTEVRLLNALGLVHAQAGSLATALAELDRALELGERELDPMHPGIATTHENLARVHTARGDEALARTHLERALAIRLESLGPRHPDVIRTRDELERR